MHGRTRMSIDPRSLAMPGRGEYGGTYSFVACLSRLTIDHASLSRRSTVLTPSRDISNKDGGRG